MKALEMLRLMRPSQWYKNLVFFIPLVFSQNLMNSSIWPLMLTGFAMLCLVSSISYAINDIVDKREDRAHPEKKKRPIASGKVSVCEACALITTLAAAVLYLSMMVPAIFSAFAAILFLSTLLYTLYLKNLALVDIHVVAVNFILRTVSGAVILNISISSWLIMVVFLLALFLAIGKRKSEIERFGRENLKKVVFKFYTRELLNRLTDITATMLLMSYILYTSFTHDYKLMFTIPVATFLVFRYLYFIQTNSEIARKSERVFLDGQMLAGILAWVVLSILLLYL